MGYQAILVIFREPGCRQGTESFRATSAIVPRQSPPRKAPPAISSSTRSARRRGTRCRSRGAGVVSG